MKSSLDGIIGQKAYLDIEQTIVKTTFLSYYVSMYNTVNENIGYNKAPVTVDEIYDFIQELRYEIGREVPNIKKDDISFCFYVLQNLGICRSE